MTIQETFKRSDPVLFLSALLLVILSLVLLATGADENSSNYLFKQAVFACVSIAVFIFLARTHYAIIRSMALPLFAGLIVLLVIVLQGKIIRGAASWLEFGGFRLQPSELAKVMITVILAKIISISKEGMARNKVLVISIFCAAVPIGLVLIQPDFGTAFLLVLIWFGVVAVANLRPRQFAALALAAALLLGSGWLFFLKDYQKQRVFTFLNPSADPLGSGYTVLQSMTAFGSGGFFGRGLGYGPQSRLNFLPENRTDFIFARIGEELGIVGVVGTLALYSIILWRMFLAAANTSDPFGKTIAVGAFTALLSGLVVNAGMNIGILPVTGVPLPFVSYGGSNLLTMFIFVGLTESVVIHGETWESDDTNDYATLISAK